MKVIIQIPCFNESDTLAGTIVALPRAIDGVDTIELLIIDDGSSDDTLGVAKRMGVHHIVRHRRNRGLAAAFNSGMQKALAEGADIIVNTDADAQYVGEDIAKIVAPVVAGKADIVVGDRGVADNPHFSLFKRRLQRLGSFVVKHLSQLEVNDAVSGFRAISREAAQRINITTDFSYTTDMLIQAGRKRLAVVSVPIRTNAAARPSRLFKSIPDFISNTGITIGRVYLTYNPLRIFLCIGLSLTLAGLAPIFRFLWFFVQGNGSGHLQSLVLGSAMVILGLLVTILGLLADLIGTNRRLIESTLHKVTRMENDLCTPAIDFSGEKEEEQVETDSDARAA
ncbi:MAG: glycosyltransferase family 2 protein [Erythrobacter sp.]